MRTPTDLQILKLIYKTYYKTFESYTRGDNTRETKNYVPIEADIIGKKLKVDGDIIFGRLYYHLNKKYSYRQDDNSKVEFFALGIKEDRHCIHFPYMVSILADLRNENRKYKTAIVIALVSIGISLISVTISILS
jgi:hypothetical protein